MVHPTVDTPRITSTKKKRYTETTNNYGTILGEQYFIPIEFRDGSSSSCSVTTESTVASSTASSSGQEEHESLSLLLRSNTLRLTTKRTSSDYIFAMFGFESNPMRSGDDNFTSNNTNNNNNNSTSTTTRRKKRRNTAAADLQLSMLSNFSTAYNVICISLALQMMKHVAVTTNDTVAAITTEKLSMLYHHMTAADTSMCSSALIAGMILGQLTLGTLGDVLGRHVAMSIVMVLQIIAAFGSSFSMSVPYYNLSIFHILAIWRFLLGLGCGGVYPLSATLTTESGNGNSSATTTTPRDRAKCVALTFSFQGFGYVIVPIVAYSIVQIFGETSDYGWRILLGLGSVPGIVLTIGRQTSSMQQRQQQQQKLKEATSRSTAIVDQTPINIDLEQPHHKIVDDALLQQQEQQPQKNTSVSHRTVPISILDAILYERQLVRKLLGTAGCWLLFDILFYGNVLFQPVVLNAAFGSTNETISKMCYHAFLLAIMALPGYYISIFAVGRQSPRYIQIQGFFVMGLLYLTIGTLFDLLSQHSVVLLTIYGLTFFFSNYGPNTTTFMLPSMTFSKSCRSTLNGICAACGKAGALIGATIFVTASRQYGEQVVFFTCALLSFAGCLLTLLCVSGRVGQHTNADDEEEEYQRQIERTMNELNGGAMVSRRPVTLRMVYSHPSIFDSFPQD